ncbi:lamin tail domain-containing protein [Lentimicrobium saccharophilum]|nr:lamin tail domain-containing protein [Lentimicrobium saccharophilum]
MHIDVKDGFLIFNNTVVNNSINPLNLWGNIVSGNNMQITFNGPVLGNPGVNIRGDVHVNYDGLEESKTYSGPTTIYSGGTLQISSNQTLGDIVLNSGATLIVDAGVTLTVTGSWTGGGTIQNNGTIVLAGTAAQTFPGAGTNIAAMNNLTINNPNGVALDQNLNVSNNLTLISGILSTSTYNITVDNPLTNSINGGGSTNYINGYLRRSINGGVNTYFFPIGTSTVYAPVQMAFTAGTVAGVLEGYTTNGDHPNIGSSNLNPAFSVNRAWYFNIVSGLGTANYNATLNWVTADQDVGFNFNTALAGKFTTSNWTYPTIGTRTANSLQITGSSGFSGFQIAADCEPDIPTVAATPDLVCPDGSSTLSITSGNLNGAANWYWYSGSCGGTPIGTGTSISVAPAATTTYYVRGEGGCAPAGGSCASITVTLDNIPPVALCQDITVYLDATGNVTITPQQVNIGSNDNCGDITLSVSPNTFNCDDLSAGGLIISEYVEGTSSNKNLEIYNAGSDPVDLGLYQLLLFTNGSPTPSEQMTLSGTLNPGAVIVYINSGSTYTGPSVTNNSVINFSGNDAIAIYNTSTGSYADIFGVIGDDPGATNGWTGSGGYQTVQRTLRRKPEVVRGVTVNPIGTGPGAFTTLTTEWDIYPLNTITGLGSHAAVASGNTVTLTVEDEAGNTSTCNANVTVIDDLAPTAVCQPVTIYLDANGIATLTPSMINNGSTDNCGIETLLISQTTFDCEDLGSNTVTLTVIDESGNSSTCSATVTVVDNIAPTADCQDITVNLDATGNITISPSDVNNNSTDNCEIASFAVSPNTFNCDDVGENTVTLTVTDNSGNVATCTAIVTVIDNTNPTAICQNITVTLDPITGTATITPDMINDGSSDACGIQSVTVSPNTFSCVDLLTTPAADLFISEYIEGSSNNKAIEIYNGTGAYIDLATGGYDLQMFFNGSNTAGLTIPLTGTVANGDVYVVAHGSSSAVILAQTDQTTPPATNWYNGNDAVVLRRGTTIIDVIGQIGFDPGNEWGTGLVSTENNTLRRKSTIIQGDGDGTDAFDPSVEWDGYAQDNIADLGSHTFSPPTGVRPVVLTVTDVNGNASTCSALVTIQDNTPPDITCPSAPATICSSGPYTHTNNSWDATATDACGVASITYTLSNATTGTGATLNGVAFNVGTTLVTWRATDVNGNWSECSYSVVINPNHTITLTSAVSTENQEVCINVSIEPITYEISGGATGVTLGGTLPAGVTGNLVGNIYTISGIPTASGVFNYTLTTTGNGCVVANESGTITVNPALPVSVTISASPSGNICGSTPVTFTALPVNEGTTPTYQWYLNANPVGGNSDTYTLNTPANNDAVYVILTSDEPCATGNPATSNTITLTLGIVEVTGTLPIPTIACYPNLGEAFAAVNDGTHQGDVIVSIQANTTEPATAILNASGGAASYTSVVVSPAAPGISVTGNLNAPLIQLNGADNVIFDGRMDAVGAPYSLTLNNTNAGNAATTIEFAAGAANNLIQFCNITGFNAIYSQGTAGNPNTENLITDNRIYDFLNPGLASNGIHLAAFNEYWTIQFNELYQTTPLVASANVEYAAIRVDAGTGNGFLVENNTIGSNGASGTWTKTGSNNVFYGIYISAGTGNSIAGNNIRDFNWTNTQNANWTGIHVAQGAVNITGNIVGAGSGAGNIQVTLGLTTAASNGIFGISHASGSASTISGNVIGAVTAGNSAANASNIYGIAKLGVPAPLTIENNQISGLQAASASTGNNQVVYGIAYEVAGGIAVISGNTIQGLSNLTTGAGGQVHGIHTNVAALTVTSNIIFNLSNSAANETGESNAAVTGIVGRFTGNGTIAGNTIYNLQSTYAARGRAIGIYYNGTLNLTNHVSENFIHSLSVATVVPGPPFGEIYGIRTNFGQATVYNNIVSLGVGMSSNAYIYGIYENGYAGNNYNYYHNTIYIGGTSTQNENNSYAFFSGNNENQKDIRNNIFHNARTSSAGVTAFHYAAHYQTNANGLTSDYNVYYFPSGRFVRMGPPTPHIFYATLADWQTAYPAQDVHSVVANSNFANPGGTAAADYVPGNPYNGVDNTGITTDYTGTLRDCAFTRGAFEAAAGAVTAVFDPETSTRCQGAGTVIYSDSALVLNDVSVFYSIESTPAGAILVDAATGEVSYPAGWSGTVTITLTATGCNGPPVTATHVATTAGNVEAPVFDPAFSERCQGAETIIYTATAVNASGISYEIDATSQAGGVSIVSNTGAVTYPDTWNGITVITATAEGCGGPLTATHTVTTNPPVGIPVFDPGLLDSRCQGEEDVQYTATAANTTGITYSIDAASTAGGVSIDANTGLVSYPATWIGITTITASAAGCNGPAVETFVVETTTALTPSVSIEIDPPGGTCAGGELTFTAIPVHGGPSPSYQWRLNGVDVPGATSEVYGPVILNDGDVVRVTMISSDPCALPDPVFSVVTVSFGIVEVFSAANPSPTCYNTLGEAFTSINNGDYVGQISVRILASTTEPVSAVLNASGGLSSYTSVRVFPQSEGISVTGDIDGPLVHLNGADGVILHGSPGGAGADTSLFYINTRVGPNATTIQLDNGATSNTITYCNLRGSGTGADRGTVYIGGGGANTNNSILRNAFTGNGDNRPANSVYSFNGTGSNTVFVEFNEFYNFFSLNNNSNGVYLHTGTGTSRINDNRFYETSSFSPTADAEYAVIRFISIGTGNQIHRNTIGGNANDITYASHWLKTASSNNLFYGIYVGGPSAGNFLSGNIHRNQISLFDWHNSGNAGFTAIHLEQWSSFHIGGTTAADGNTIGSATGTDNIILTQGETSVSELLHLPQNSSRLGFIGIAYQTYLVTNIRFNTIGAISTNTSTPDIGCHLFGIAKLRHGTHIPLPVNNNTITNLNANSLSTGATQWVYGIFYDVADQSGDPWESGYVRIHNNTVAQLTNNGTNAATLNQSSRVQGIHASTFFLNIYENTIRDLVGHNGSTEVEKFVSVGGIIAESIFNEFTYNGERGYVEVNTIFNLSNVSGARCRVTGLYYKGPTSNEIGSDYNTITRNFIHSLSVSNTSAVSQIFGIFSRGQVAYSNNIISLGFNVPVNASTEICGIREVGRAGNNTNIYFNTVSIGGNSSVGSSNANSYAFYSENSFNLKRILNNLFHNVRTGPAANTHAAIRLFSNSGVTIDYNNYWSQSGVVGRMDAANIPLIGDWRAATGQDVHSVNISTDFTVPFGEDPYDYIPLNPQAGVSIPEITWDFSLADRDCNNTMGAWETDMITLTASDGIPSGSYRTLADAFDKINDGTHQGDIDIKINCNTFEVRRAILYQSGYNSTSLYNRVRIYPAQPDIRVSGEMDEALIVLDGADNVTISGRINYTGADRNLTLDNYLPAPAYRPYAMTVQLLNGTTNDSIAGCIIRGGSISNGVIDIRGGGNNHNNVFINNLFTNTGIVGNETRAAAFFMSTGSGGTNTGIIANNEFRNVLRLSRNPETTARVDAILLNSGNSDWTISGNSFYETGTYATTNSVELSCIRIGASGNNFIIENNFIGGNAPGALGFWNKTGFNNNFTAIHLATGTGAGNVVRGNVIRGFNWTNSGGTTGANWTGIHIQDGSAVVGGTDAADGNLIGSADPAETSITVTNGATGGTFYGINNFTNSQIFPAWRLIQHNTIGGIRTNTTNNSAFSINAIANTNTLAFRPVIVRNSTITNLHALSSTADIQEVVGIRYNVSNDYITVEDNLIDNLQNGSNPAGGQGITSGIWIRQSARAIVSNNTVSNLTSAMGNSQSDHAAAVTGIVAFGYENLNVTGNTVNNLHSTFTTGGLQVTGIVAFASGANPAAVNRNFVHSFSLASQNTGAHMNGIRIVRGLNLTVFNNIVHLTTESTLARTIYGIYDHGAQTGDATRIYYNTVMIGGIAPAANQNNSYGLWSSSGANNKDYQNNVFSNFRSNANAGATGRHYAVFFTDTPVAGFISDYNNLYAPGTGGITGRMPSGEYPTLNSWQTATTQDAHSLSVDPVFALPGGSDPADYFPSAAMPGLTGLGGITDDFGTDAVRTDPVTMGAWENDCNGLVNDEPDAFTECENATVTFTIGVSNVTTPVYQWQVSFNGGLTWTDLTETPPYSGTNSPVLTITDITITMDGSLYRCRVTDADNGCVVISAGALLNVNPRPTTGAIWHQ